MAASDAPPAAAEAAAPAAGPLLLLPVQADPVFAPLDRGVERWLQAELEALGLRALAADASAGAPASREAVQAALRSTGAAHALQSELRFAGGEVTLRLRLEAADPDADASGVQMQGPLADLGELLAQAVAGLPGVGAAPSAPAVAELAALERADRALEAGEAAHAWRELEGVRARAAEGMRAHIEREAAQGRLSVAERSRLATLRSVSDAEWLHVRRGIAEGRDPELLMAGAESARAQQDPERALRLYDAVVALQPKRAEAQLARAQLLAELGRADEARAAYARAAELRPDDPAPWEGLARLDAAPAERAARWLEAAQRHARRLEPDAAREAFEAAARADAAALASARGGVGRLEESLGHPQEALIAYEEAAATRDDDAELMLGLGRTRARAEDAKGAESAFERALALRPGDPEALRGLGDVMLATKRPERAVEVLRAAVDAEPADARGRRALARAYRMQGDPEQALAVLDAEAVPRPERPGVLADAADLYLEEGRPEDARNALERAVAIAPTDAPLHEALVRVHRARGDEEAAQAESHVVVQLSGVPAAASDAPQADGLAEASGDDAVFTELAALVRSFPVESPATGEALGSALYLGVADEAGIHAFVRRWLLPRSLDRARLDAQVAEALSTRFALLPPPHLPEVAESAHARVLGFSTARADIALVNDVLGADAGFVARLRRSPRAHPLDPAGAPLTLEVRMLGGRREGEVFILANALRIRDAAGLVDWNRRALVPYGALLLLMLLPVLRGWGSLRVQLEVERRRGAKGFFSIQISRRPARARFEKPPKGGSSREKRYMRRVRSWSRFARHMVGPETLFRWLPARSYFVVVHGLLQDTATGEVIGNYVEEKPVRVERGRVTETRFDLRPSEAVLEVRVFDAEGEPGRARVVLKGRPDTLRYAKDGSTLLHVGTGRHRVLVGEDDRVFEVEVAVDELAATHVAVHLGEDDRALFTGCPDAVAPLLDGDVPTACDALEQAGCHEAAHALRGEFHRERGETAEAARCYEAAGQLAQAAELSAVVEGAPADHSATLFEQAGDYGRAAERWAAAGDPARAAAAWEAAYQYDAAIEAWKAAGRPEKAAELLEGRGRHFEAAQLAMERDDEETAIRNLQRVDPRDPDYAESCRQLAELFGRREEWSLALEKAREAVQIPGEDAAPLELLEQLGRLLEQAGHGGEALEVYEGIRKRDFQYPGIAERIETLRRRATEAAQSAATQAAQAGSLRAATDARYELLEEIGRGGMGVVYKARDRRLGRVVALKRLPENLRNHPTAVQLFLREARAAAALNHTNIVTLFDADQDEGGHYFITMELLEGLPLDAILRKRERLGVKDTLRLAVQIATGLQYAHERRIVHRDIKTSNLFFTRDRVIKVMDFGLAKMVEEVRRAATVIGGTPYYMAPEQAAGEAVDHRADLYAFGVTLFELLSGRVPFTEGDVAYHHRHTPPPDLRERVPGLPDPLVELVRALLAKRPGDRPANTAEVTAALHRMLQS